MTIEELREYRNIKAKILSIEAEIEMNYNTVGSVPPKEVISGRSSVRQANDPTAKAFDRNEALRAQQAYLLAEAERIEQWVDSLTDIMISAIIQAHYLAGLSWKQTARKIYGRADYGDACRITVKRFIENCS